MNRANTVVPKESAAPRGRKEAWTPAEREQGQRAALRANVLTNVVNSIVIGPLMMLFANDTLGMSPKRISAVLAILPIVGLARIAALEPLRRLGLRRAILGGDTLRVFVIAALFALLPRGIGFALFTGLLCLYVAGQQLGVGMAWQPLLRDLTTDADRGRFFARMRFWFQIVTAGTMTLLPFWLGERIELGQYRWLLLLALVGTMNRMYWVWRIPEQPATEEDAPRRIVSPRLWRTLRHSRLLRLPLLISAALLLVQAPIYVVYLRTMMNAPANIVSIFIAAGTFGVVASLLLWGRIADALGFRPMLTGLLLLKLALLPLHLLIAPFPDPFPGWAQAELAAIVTVSVLIVHGFLNGALLAGIGLAETSIKHWHVRSDESFEAMNLFQMALIPVTAGTQFFFGWLLNDVAMPRGHVVLANGVFWYDALKGYLFFGAGPILVLILLALRRLPNTRPWFGIGHFFTSLSMAPLRLMMAERRIFHEDEDTRCRTARWFAAHPSPLAVEPLCDLLNDPSYDVRVAAIRALAETGSELAGQRLLAVFEDPNARFVAAHAAWALGELRYRPAVDALCEALADTTRAELPAMAARALGKIGDERAVAPLVARLQAKPARRKVVSSVARALLRFEEAARRHADLLFEALADLDEREDRYEIMDGLCSLLRIGNAWLLRHLEGREGARRALEAYADLQSESWRTRNAPLLQALAEKNHETLRNHARRQADPDDAVQQALLNAMALRPTGVSIHIVAAAWLMLRNSA